MKTGILHLPSGISGDMFLGALADAGAPLTEMEKAVRAVGGDALALRAEETMRSGLRGLHVDVLVDGVPLVEAGGPAPEHDHDSGSAGKPHRHGHHAHRPYAEIVSLIEGAALPDAVRSRSLEVFRRLGEAEARLHGTTLAEVHFHEVGSWDAIADVVGTVAGIHALGLERLYHGPVSVGGGRTGAAHGLLPVPAPATLALLDGCPCIFEEGLGELTTPTGAALVTALAEPLPGDLALTPLATGYGAGRWDPPGRPNLARLVVGESAVGASGRGRVAVVEASLDDCTPEEGGHLVGALLDAGALDVTLTPVIMKKSRPGFLLRVIAPAASGEDFAERVVRESSSLGARWRVEDRVELDRRVDRVRLDDGEVRVKVALLSDGGERPHVEFEDLAELARRRGVPLAELRREVEQRWRETR